MIDLLLWTPADGFAPKGSSIIMYSNRKWRSYQFFVSTDWQGGVYPSPSLAGSRPGALLAGAWAALLTMSHEGYLASCKEIVGAARSIENRIRAEVPEVTILGKPMVTVVAFRSDTLDIYEVGDKMSERGWHCVSFDSCAYGRPPEAQLNLPSLSVRYLAVNALQNPPALHICCTRLTVPVVDAFIADLKGAIEEARALPSGQGKGTMVQIYGLGKSTVSGPFIVDQFAKLYLDVLYDV